MFWRSKFKTNSIAAWQTHLTESLPEELRGSLPTIEEIEAELASDLIPSTRIHIFHCSLSTRDSSHTSSSPKSSHSANS